jgi:GIY-YIG catalytic domain
LKYYIYKITNKLNNKSYIGKTTQVPKTRWRQHVIGMGYGKYMPIHLALKKYKSNNFNFEIIKECINTNDMNFSEIYFIDKFNTLSPYGYNVDFNVRYLKDNPYLINESNTSLAVQSIPSEPVNSEYNLGKRTRYPIELWYEIKRLYLDGKSPKDICKFLEITVPHRTMISKLQVLGCDTSSKTRNKIRGNGRFLITDSEKLNIVTDFKNGFTPVQLEKKHKRSSKIIKKALVDAGLYVSRDKKICRTVQRCTEVVDKKPLR